MSHYASHEPPPYDPDSPSATVKATAWLSRRLARAAPWDTAEPATGRALRTFWLDGLFLAFGGAFADPFVSLYALGMGATPAQIGLLSSIPGAMAVVGSLWAHRFACRLRSNKMAAWLGNRVSYQSALLLFAVLPWLIPNSPSIVYALILAVGLRTFLSNLGAPGWAAFAAAITPESLRGRFFSARHMAKVFSALVGVPIAGLLIARFGGYPAGYQRSFVLGFLLLSASTYLFTRIAEPEESRPVAHAHTHAGYWWQTKNFLRFAIATFLWGLSANVAGPFYPVFMMRSLGLHADAIGLLTTVATACQFLALPYLGILNDRKGSRWLTTVGTLVAAPLPLAWLLVRSGWHIAPIQALMGVTQASLNVGTFNLMLLCIPDGDHTRYIGIYYTISATAGIVAPLIGGFLFQHFGLGGTVIVNSVGAFIAGLVFLFLVKETRPSPALS